MQDSGSESGRFTFTPPKGWVAPEGINGGEFDIVCTFRVQDGGKLSLTKLGDTEVGEDLDESSETEHKPNYKEYSSGLMNQMPPETQE